MKKLITTILIATLVATTQAQVIVSWNAYNDFYLYPGASGWTGSTYPSQEGSAWGYYAANVNGFGLPSQIGSYFTTNYSGAGTQNLYQYSDYSPLGPGYVFANSGWADTGGAGFAYYSDNLGWGSSLGRYDSPWFSGAPGLSHGLTNLMWLQSGWLGSNSTEGIASVLSFTVPTAGVYTITGKFIAGNQGANGASVAVVDNIGTPLLARTELVSDQLTDFSFTQTYDVGDTIQFQVGSNFTTGNAVGLDVTIIPEPSAASLLGAGALALVLLRKLKRL